MSGAVHPLTQYVFMAWCLVKAQGELYLYLYLTMQISNIRGCTLLRCMRP